MTTYEARVWAIPAEPGPEVGLVRAARDTYGLTLWWRNPHRGTWELRRGDGTLLTWTTSWTRLLLRYGPLTDASPGTPDPDEGMRRALDDLMGRRP